MQDEAPDHIMPFGRHKGRRLRQIKVSYLDFMINHPQRGPWIKQWVSFFGLAFVILFRVGSTLQPTISSCVTGEIIAERTVTYETLASVSPEAHIVAFLPWKTTLAWKN
jgi:hypothetical protein